MEICPCIVSINYQKVVFDEHVSVFTIARARGVKIGPKMQKNSPEIIKNFLTPMCGQDIFFKFSRNATSRENSNIESRNCKLYHRIFTI
mmetsp:Transcript_15117/g.38093  ORF Transcript_15117/g.38093 Transcript_15117/m.38093 type:complete len:89 (-) Transcript_15117:47-313(-)